MQSPRHDETPPLRLAIVGGGRRCLSILEMLDRANLERLNAEIVGVADEDADAAGLAVARQRGIHTCSDYHDLLSIAGLNLILELSGREEVLRDLADTKPATVGVLDFEASVLFGDLASFSRKLEEKEDEITLERSFAQTLTRAASEGVMVLDQSYRILRINHEACRRAGIGPEDAQGRYCFQVLRQAVTPCHGPDTPCPMLETLSTGKSAHAIQEHVYADGETRYCDVSTYPLINRRGEVVQVLEIFRDITDDLAARVESRTRVLKEDLSKLVQEDKLIALGKLVASVAHEINNPIGSILNFTKLIRKTIQESPPTAEDLARFDRWLALTVREAERCGQIVGNLLSFARQQTVEARQIDLAELVQKIAQLTAHQMELSNVKFKSELPAGELTIWGDPSQIQQCITNLVFNALEAMPRGGLLTIRGERDAERGRVRLTISDTGEGIEDEHLSHIFEPFFSTKKEGKGVGLGLSMVFGIIREHRGEIEVQSTPGQGTTFQLIFPTNEEATA